jgi:dTDP-4-amino-4,6-dideoxygalactose transaminase
MIHKKQILNQDNLERKYFFHNGRTAFFHSMKLLGLNKDKKILLPNYIGINKKEGSGVLDPIQKVKAGFEFYKLNSDLSVNHNDFEKKIKNKNVAAVLVIHYFGFCQNDMDKIVRICKTYGKYLIEDCAHAFNSYNGNTKLGSYGDCSFFSIHKFLAVNDGGFLLINNSNIVTNLKDEIDHKTLLILNKSKINEISKKRRNNFSYLLRIINKMPGTYPFYRELPKGIVPLNFPIIIKNKNRDDVYFKLLEQHIETVSLYHTLIPELNKLGNSMSFELSRKILNLPIHENISKKDLDLMVLKLNEVLSGD